MTTSASSSSSVERIDAPARIVDDLRASGLDMRGDFARLVVPRIVPPSRRIPGTSFGVNRRQCVGSINPANPSSIPIVSAP